MVRKACFPALLLLAAPSALAAAGAPVPNTNGTLGTAFSNRQIHAYASTLLEIQKIRQAVSFRIDSLPQDKADLLQERAKAEMMQALSRHGLDVATFNAISSAVDKQRSLRREVRQLMMEEKLSI
ncbi:DUF4168 domain-containing protein [Sphingobium chungbukense]|uniref:DUF4168 domain-containing protein n=1 Tax=Sphingobium chungbukense TaxID=56193 RepID=A0A0M3APR6_9SPHN|nr:DUF4168 domain-containing protein [Sphingobium chungbukense]KKW90534.1 hypothetical protein YP76_18205 [Sphingobium chungbukense]